MEWIERLNNAVEYMEAHLLEKIDYEKVAEIANCPAYYFQRMFLYMTNISVSEYIRRRKMSLAAVDLQDAGAKVIDIALKYGYDSPTAFNRAFQSIHGIAPFVAKKENANLKSYPAIKFSISIQGMAEMNFRIETKEAFRIVGKSCPISKVLEENFARIPHEWDTALENGTLAKLYGIMNDKPEGLLGVSVHNEKEWKYFIAVSSTEDSDNFEQYNIPVATWAVFSGRGTNVSLQELERRVITEWLPTSGYEYAEIPDIEVYIKADPKEAIYEYWLPVVKKEENSGSINN